MHKNHAVIWMDHREAHVLYFAGGQDESIHSQSTHTHLHHKAHEIGSGNAPEDRKFFDNVIAALKDVGEILIIGPGSAKAEFATYIQAHHPEIAKHIAGVETVDHPTDPQVLAYAKKYFARIDSGKFAH